MGEIAELLEEFDYIGDGTDKRPPERTRQAPVMTGFIAIPSVMMGPGVYALIRHGEIVYIGKAKLLLQRIGTHHQLMRRKQAGKAPPLNGWGAHVKTIVFTDVRVLACAASDLDRIEREMITKYRPRYNERLKPTHRASLEELGFKLPTKSATVVPFVRRV